MRWLATALAALAAAAALGAQAAQEPRGRADEKEAETRLFLFVSPSDPELKTLPAEIRRVAGVLQKKNFPATLRPVLLLGDFKAVGRLHANEAFFGFVKELAADRGPGFELALYDEECLAWAEKLAIRETPAWALVATDPKTRELCAHVAYGARAKIEEVATCRDR